MSGGVGVSTIGREATLVFGAALDVGLERGLFSLFRFGFTRTSAAVARTTARGTVETDLAWTLARASACPLRVPLAGSRRLAFAPCGGVGVGVLSASAAGTALARSEDRSRAFVAAELAGRLEAEPFGGFFVGVEVAAGFPFIRDEIAVDPTLEVYRAPPVVVNGEIGAGVRFP